MATPLPLYSLPLSSDHDPPTVSIVSLSVSTSGRLLCALTAHCVWLYSVLQDDCVCLGGWKRSPRLHDEEGDNIAVAFNQLSASTGRQSDGDVEEDDSNESGGDGDSSDGAAEQRLQVLRRTRRQARRCTTRATAYLPSSRAVTF